MLEGIQLVTAWSTSSKYLDIVEGTERKSASKSIEAIAVSVISAASNPEAE